MDMNEAIEPLRSLDADKWDDMDVVESAARMSLDVLAGDPAVIRAALRDIPRTPGLLPLCEHYDILDKIVLHDDPTGFRVRLHVFLPGYFDRPHNHRWSYASMILHGAYRHHLYGNAEVNQDIDPGSLAAVMIRREAPGDFYALHHSMVHAVVAEPHTVSLVVRGPAVKDRFLVMDRTTGRAWWQYGTAKESADEASRKRMSAERFGELSSRLDEWGVFCRPREETPS
jgi:predicted metal-dependent enzyme (double-stranded beta helix superfamily)